MVLKNIVLFLNQLIKFNAQNHLLAYSRTLKKRIKTKALKSNKNKKLRRIFLYYA